MHPRWQAYVPSSIRSPMGPQDSRCRELPALPHAPRLSWRFTLANTLPALLLCTQTPCPSALTHHSPIQVHEPHGGKGGLQRNTGSAASIGAAASERAPTTAHIGRGAHGGSSSRNPLAASPAALLTPTLPLPCICPPTLPLCARGWIVDQVPEWAGGGQGGQHCGNSQAQVL